MIDDIITIIEKITRIERIVIDNNLEKPVIPKLNESNQSLWDSPNILYPNAEETINAKKTKTDTEISTNFFITKTKKNKSNVLILHAL